MFGGRATRLGLPVIEVFLEEQQVFRNCGGGFVGLMTAVFESPQGVAGGVHLPPLPSAHVIVGLVSAQKIGREF